MSHTSLMGAEINKEAKGMLEPLTSTRKKNELIVLTIEIQNVQDSSKDTTFFAQRIYSRLHQEHDILQNVYVQVFIMHNFFQTNCGTEVEP